jgi:peptide/nickel transport system substrate-binding protein
MRANAIFLWLSVVGSLVVGACAPGGAAPQTTAPDVGAQPSPPKTLTIALQGEPKAINTIMGGDVGGSPGRHLGYMLHQSLAMYDNKGNAFPQLAVELPTQEKGTWVVSPDGTMQTRFRLRPSIRWHDGKPLTAEDIRFAWTVAMDPELPVESRSLARQITSIETPDDSTLVIHWARPYPLANAPTDNDLLALPSHLLREVFETDKDRFQRLPYWNIEFIGVGPYRLDSWELGSHVVAKANEEFYGGRPRIDTLILRFIPDESTLLANLLAGSVDGEFRALDFDKVMVARDQMESAGLKPHVIAQPTFTRIIRVQYENPRPQQIVDVRVRRALLMAIDRAGMADTIYRGQSSSADLLFATDDPKYDWVKDSATRYPYDPRQAQELLGQVGWERRPDGAVRDASGERVTLSHWTTQGGQWETDQSITADSWRSIGLAIDQYVIPTAVSRDRETRAKFPNFAATPIPFRMLPQANLYLTSECPSERTRWAGANSGCYQDPDMDRVSQAILSTVDQGQQRQLWAERIRLDTQHLPALPLYYHMQGAIFREGVSGIKGEPRGAANASGWDVMDWDVK